MKRLTLGILALALVLAPFAVGEEDTAVLTIGAEWQGGLALSLDKTVLSFPLQTFPHEGAWSSAVEGDILATVTSSLAAGAGWKLSMTSSAWTPGDGVELAPETTLQFAGRGSLGGMVFPFAAAGTEMPIFSSGPDPAKSVELEFAFELKNVQATPGGYSLTVNFLLVDEL